MPSFRQSVKTALIEYGKPGKNFGTMSRRFIPDLEIDRQELKRNIKTVKMDDFHYLPITELRLKNNSSTLDFLAEILSLIQQDSFTLRSKLSYMSTFELNCRKNDEFLICGVAVCWEDIIPSIIFP